MTERQRKAWESSLNPLFGPPNWLVQEEWKRDKKGEPTEPFDVAMLRVRVRYGLPEAPPVPRGIAEAWEWYARKMVQPGAHEERERRIKAALEKDEVIRAAVSAPSPVSAPSEDLSAPKVCKTCNKDMEPQRGLECYACQKRRQRG